MSLFDIDPTWTIDATPITEPEHWGWKEARLRDCQGPRIVARVFKSLEESASPGLGGENHEKEDSD